MALDSPTFNKSNADIVIRSSDNINFRLHKAILGEASPVFEGLIDLPLPPMPTDSDDVYDGVPVVRLPEDSGTLERLFRIMYPMIDPIMETPDEISRVLTAASKYLMEGARAFCIKALMECKLLEREPLRVFAIACRFRLGAEARTSARQILSHKRLDLSRGTPPIELDDIPATVLFQLLDYVATCNEYADFVVHDETTWEVDFTRDLGFWCTTCGFTGSNAIVRKTRLHRKVGRYRELAYELLSKMPCASTELPELLTNTALMSLKWTEFGCSTCREKVIHALREFNTCLFRKINDGVYLLVSNVSTALLLYLSRAARPSSRELIWTFDIPRIVPMKQLKGPEPEYVWSCPIDSVRIAISVSAKGKSSFPRDTLSPSTNLELLRHESGEQCRRL